MTFEDFWLIYPKTTGQPKAPARKAWEKLKCTEDLFNEIRLSIQAQVRYRADAKQQGEFVPDWPMPSTFINQRRWEVDIPSHAELKERHSLKTCTVEGCQYPVYGSRFSLCEDHVYLEPDWRTPLLKDRWKELQVQKVNDCWRTPCLSVIWKANPTLAKLIGR